MKSRRSWVLVLAVAGALLAGALPASAHMYVRRGPVRHWHAYGYRAPVVYGWYAYPAYSYARPLLYPVGHAYCSSYGPYFYYPPYSYHRHVRFHFGFSVGY